MNRSVTILQKVIVRTYYLENTSFFLLIVALAGGFMSAVEHRALAELFISSPYTMLIPIAVWMIYALKVINFNTALLGRSENEFLFHFILYTTWKKRLMAWSIASAQFAPAFLYGIFLISQALKHQVLLPVIIAIGALVAQSMLIAWLLYQNLHHPNREKKISRWRRFLNRHFTRPYPTFALEWISRQNPAMMIGTKVFASAILFGILKLYTTDIYDFRLLAMGTIIAAAISAQLIGEVHRFDTFYFILPRQLPLSIASRLFSMLTCIALLYLPETGMIITYFPKYLSPLLIAASVTCMWSVAWLWYAMQYQKPRTADDMSKIVFASTIAWIVLTLFSTPLWLIAATNIATGYFLWKKYYYRFESAISTGNSQT